MHDQNGMTRRAWIQAGMAGSLAGMTALSSAPAAAADAKPSSLTITKVETFALQHKLPKKIGPSTLLYGFRDALLVKVTTDSGLVGWGETADVGGTQGAIEEGLKPSLLGANPLDERKLWRKLFGANYGNGQAVAGIDMALLDVRGKALKQSVGDMFGGRIRDTVPVYCSAMNYTEGVDPEDQHPAEAAALVKRGFRAMKSRTGRFGLKKDLKVLTKVRAAVGDDIRLLTDGNGGFTFEQAVKFGKELEKLDYYFFEEPLPQGLNYAGYDVLAASLDLPLAGGEVLDSRTSARDHIVKRSFDIIQPDVSLCGGVAEVLFIAEMAKLWGIQCIPHCWGGAISITATQHLLSLMPPFNWGASSDEPMLEFDVYENPFRDEILTTKFELKDGRLPVPTGHGLGIEVNEDVVKKYLVKN